MITHIFKRTVSGHGVTSGLRDKERGFALIITITLLAFLVLLLVSLASLTRVETQVAANAQQLSQARQHALMALNIALGELQRTTGPDQRTTARADLQITLPASKHWIAAYGPGNDPATAVSGAAPFAPKVLNWLVSGNEGNAFATPTANGQITGAPATPVYTPDQAITGTATATSTDLKINGNAAALLVGPKTVGTAAAATVDYVVAPKVPITADSVPGLSGPQTIGNYAWWVGDEGMKARSNLVDPIAAKVAAGTATTAEKLSRVQSAQRSGVEAVTDLSAYPVNDTVLSRVQTIGQLSLVSGLTPAVTQPRFHDLTTTSAGVLADTRYGGLKRDGSYLLALPDRPTLRTTVNGIYGGTGAAPNTIAGANPIITATTTPFGGSVTAPFNQYGLTWEQLWSFGNMGKTVANGGVFNTAGTQVQPRRHGREPSATETRHGVAPVLVHARIFFGLRVDTARRVFVNFRPLVVLANPYAVDMAGADYYVRLDTGPGIAIYRTGAATPVAWSLSNNSLYGNGTTARMRFRIPASASALAAGQAKVFTARHRPAEHSEHNLRSRECV